MESKNVIVNASALRSSGALSIYNQFITHLPNYINNNKYYLFVDPSVNQPVIDGVTYIQDGNHGWLHRLSWEHGGLNRWLRRNNISPDIIVSLQNTGIVTNCRQIIYYHQSLPFYSWKWNLLKKSERLMWLYKYLYPYFVQLTLNRQTDIVVQIPFVRRKFIDRFHFPPEKVHVLFPDLEQIDTSGVSYMDWDYSKKHFIFPATPLPYKEHRIILEALGLLKQRKSPFFQDIRVHFTISKGQSKSVDKLIMCYGLQKQIIFDGVLPHDVLLSYYQSACGLIFPSVIETLGLPLLEAARFGLPILVSDLDYAHEVLQNYNGATFLESSNIELWAGEIEKIASISQRYNGLLPQQTSWGIFFDIINK